MTRHLQLEPLYLYSRLCFNFQANERKLLESMIIDQCSKVSLLDFVSSSRLVSFCITSFIFLYVIFLLKKMVCS
ncbi:hypothetical protein MtrunA17_Chr7g0248321 [Medicago truncatula]|uniref:Transmembrane protein n=1 Tax=Medicago truncatula TaxID=3880 RepID=I3SE68_MEDTR|nr:unknown [Medicago truncatula]RHN47011.1 hypothetical protein MtrunA17_Chr7g0248321 [Medicago truncatula]